MNKVTPFRPKAEHIFIIIIGCTISYLCEVGTIKTFPSSIISVHPLLIPFLTIHPYLLRSFPIYSFTLMLNAFLVISLSSAHYALISYFINSRHTDILTSATCDLISSDAFVTQHSDHTGGPVVCPFCRSWP